MKATFWILVGLGVAAMALIRKPSFVVDRLAQAFALAEGWYVAGSRAQRNHNPGDLTLPMGFNYVGFDGQFVIFATDADGWGALKELISRMLDNSSAIYNSSMTIAEVAAKYTATESDVWAANVARALGVTVDTRLDQLSNG